MLMTNPDFKKVVDTIGAMGDPKTAFYKLAEQRGVNPDSILGLLK